MKDKQQAEQTNQDSSACSVGASKKSSQILSNSARPSNLKRRHIVGGTLTGVAAAVWHKPIINAMVLPAHAQMSAANQFFAAAAAVTPIAKHDSLLDSIVSPAYAVAIATESEYSVMVVQPTAGVNSYAVDVFERKLEGESNVGEIVYSGTAAIGAAASLAVLEDPCETGVGALAIELVSVDATQAVINLTAAGGQITVPAGMGTLPIPMCVDSGLPNSFFSDMAEPTFVQLGMNSLIDSLVPVAHAGLGNRDNGPLTILATKIDENNFEVSFLNFTRNVERSGTLNVNGTSGSLAVVSDACSANPGTSSGDDPVDARILMVDNSEMGLRIDFHAGSEPADFVIPAQSGSLNLSCDITVNNFTNNSGGLNQLADASNSLLETIIPQAHAGTAPGAINQFICNAAHSNGSFAVELAAEIELGGLELNAGYNSLWSGSVPLNTPTQLTQNDGCPETAEVTIVKTAKPNRLRLSLTTGSDTITAELREGTQALPLVSGCALNE